MDADRRPPHPRYDQTLALLAGGYAWLPQRMRDSGGEPALTTRLMGKPVLLLLDVYGQNHDAGLWGDPYAFRPDRFLEHPAERDELIPQGGGDPRTGHRCPGEGVALGLLESLAVRLAGLEYEVPAQDLRIPLRRIPTRPRDGFVMSGVRAPEHRTNTPTDIETNTKEPPAWDTAETSSTN